MQNGIKMTEILSNDSLHCVIDFANNNAHAVCPVCGALMIYVTHKQHWVCGCSCLCGKNRILEPSEDERLRTLLDKIYRHWQEGVSEDTENEKPWHGKMRDLLNEI